VIFLSYAFAAALIVWSFQSAMEDKQRRQRRRQRHTHGIPVARREVAAPAQAERPLRKQAAKQATAQAAPKQAAPDLMNKDVVSCLKNLGYGAKDATAAAQRTAGRFEQRLRGSLAILKEVTHVG